MTKPTVPGMSPFGNPCMCCPPAGMFSAEVVGGMTPKAPPTPELTPEEIEEANRFYDERNEATLTYRMERGE